MVVVSLLNLLFRITVCFAIRIATIKQGGVPHLLQKVLLLTIILQGLTRPGGPSGKSGRLSGAVLAGDSVPKGKASPAARPATKGPK